MEQLPNTPKDQVQISLEYNKNLDKIREWQSKIIVLPLEEMINMYEKMVDYAHHIQAEYPNWQKYPLLHALIGSTIASGKIDNIYEDFPGDDSIIKFIENSELKYLKMNGVDKHSSTE